MEDNETSSLILGCWLHDCCEADSQGLEVVISNGHEGIGAQSPAATEVGIVVFDTFPRTRSSTKREEAAVRLQRFFSEAQNLRWQRQAHNAARHIQNLWWKCRTRINHIPLGQSFSKNGKAEDCETIRVSVKDCGVKSVSSHHIVVIQTWIRRCFALRHEQAMVLQKYWRYYRHRELRRRCLAAIKAQRICRALVGSRKLKESHPLKRGPKNCCRSWVSPLTHRCKDEAQMAALKIQTAFRAYRDGGRELDLLDNSEFVVQTAFRQWFSSIQSSSLSRIQNEDGFRDCHDSAPRLESTETSCRSQEKNLKGKCRHGNFVLKRVWELTSSPSRTQTHLTVVSCGVLGLLIISLFQSHKFRSGLCFPINPFITAEIVPGEYVSPWWIPLRIAKGPVFACSCSRWNQSSYLAVISTRGRFSALLRTSETNNITENKVDGVHVDNDGIYVVSKRYSTGRKTLFPR